MVRRAGLRQARQALAGLIEQVKKGREIEITDRGRPVARLVPPGVNEAKPFGGRAAVRAEMPRLRRPASQAVLDEREES